MSVALKDQVRGFQPPLLFARFAGEQVACPHVIPLDFTGGGEAEALLRRPVRLHFRH